MNFIELASLDFTSIFLVVNSLFSIIIFIILILTRSNLKKTKKKYNKLMNGFGELNIEELLEAHISQVNKTIAKNKELEENINLINKDLLNCIQKVGIVRYNAFDNMGSDLSFAIALLDLNNDGIILNGIYSREGSCVYAKPISKLKSKYQLSLEETEALEVAINKKNKNVE